MSMNWSHQITAIQNWQMSTGNIGAPPRSVDARLSQWVRWAQRQARMDPALAVEMEALGIDTYRDKQGPRYREESLLKHGAGKRSVAH
jgi:hypothetical protein